MKTLFWVFVGRNRHLFEGGPTLTKSAQNAYLLADMSHLLPFNQTEGVKISAPINLQSETRVNITDVKNEY